MAEVELPDPHELEERRDKAFSRRVALTTAIYAVVLAIASLGGQQRDGGDPPEPAGGD